MENGKTTFWAKTATFLTNGSPLSHVLSSPFSSFMGYRMRSKASCGRERERGQRAFSHRGEKIELNFRAEVCCFGAKAFLGRVIEFGLGFLLTQKCMYFFPFASSSSSSSELVGNFYFIYFTSTNSRSEKVNAPRVGERMSQKFGGGKMPTGTPSLGWSSVVVVISLLAGASVVHNIYKPNLTLPALEEPPHGTNGKESDEKD